MRHDLKTWPAFFRAVEDGRKLFEVRKNDRDFKVGDVLRLREWDPDRDEYTGRSVERFVMYVLHDSRFLPEGTVVMSIAPVADDDRSPPDSGAR